MQAPSPAILPQAGRGYLCKSNCPGEGLPLLPGGKEMEGWSDRDSIRQWGLMHLPIMQTLGHCKYFS